MSITPEPIAIPDAIDAALSADDTRKDPGPGGARTPEQTFREMPRDEARTRSYRIAVRIAALIEGIWLAGDAKEAPDGAAADRETLALVGLLRTDLTRLHTLRRYHPEVSTTTVTLDV